MSDNLFVLLFTMSFVISVCTYKGIRYFMDYRNMRKLYDIVPVESLSQILMEQERIKIEKRRRSSLMWAGGILGLGLGIALGAIIFNSNVGTIVNTTHENASFIGFILLWVATSITLTAAGIIAAYFIDRKLEK